MTLAPTDALFDQCGPALWLVTAAHEENRGGLVASFVAKVSLPKAFPRVAVGIAKHHHTWSLIQRSGAFGLHLLGEGNSDLAIRFGLQSGRDVDKYDRLPFRTAHTGNPVLFGTLGWLDCRVEADLDIGDRTIFVAEVLGGEASTGSVLKTDSLVAKLSPAQLAEMRRALEQDSELDSEAIVKWRQSRLGS
jgi:flavin reductase (DIM6/NTAB) family NADH-FMN oxidoreductase RutF